MRPKWQKVIFFVPLVILGIVLFIFIGGQMVMHLWNCLLPPLFGWRTITFWQALGLLALSRILFGGMSGGHRYRPSGFRNRIKDRCGNLTPEEREQFRQRLRERWGFGPSTKGE